MDQKQEIIRALKAARITQKNIAEMLKVSPVCVHEVVAGKRKNPRIRLAIALAIGKKVEEIWPKENSPSPADRSADRR